VLRDRGNRPTRCLILSFTISVGFQGKFKGGRVCYGVDGDVYIRPILHGIFIWY